jgi:hypothetical protein
VEAAAIVSPLLACATCMSDPDSQITLAANSAILLMVGVLVLVFGSILVFIRYLARCAAAAAPPRD